MSRDIEQYAKDYLCDDFEKIMSRYRKQMIVDLLKENSARRILEIGPAYNFCYKSYVEFEQYTCVEPSTIMCNLMPKEKNVHIINDYLENCTDLLRNESFDFIIFSGLLHEIEDEQRVLACLHDLCRPETMIHISVPNCKSFHLQFAYEAGLIPQIGVLTDYSQKMQRCRTYDIEHLKSVLENAGFEIAGQGSFFLKLFNQSKMISCLAHGILDDALLDALSRMGNLFPDRAAEIYCNVKIRKESHA